MATLALICKIIVFCLIHKIVCHNLHNPDVIICLLLNPSMPSKFTISNKVLVYLKKLYIRYCIIRVQYMFVAESIYTNCLFVYLRLMVNNECEVDICYWIHLCQSGCTISNNLILNFNKNWFTKYVEQSLASFFFFFHTMK